MKIRNYRDLDVWQEAMSLAVDLHKTFRENRDLVFRNQIAEGFDRESTKDFLRFLFIANTSNSETESMLFFGKEVGYLTAEQAAMYLQRCIHIRKMLWGLIKSLRKRIA